MIRAYQWRALLEVGQYQSLEELAQAEKLKATYVARLLPLAFLAPDLTDGILDGPRGDSVTVDQLRYKWLPVGWADQRRALARTSGHVSLRKCAKSVGRTPAQTVCIRPEADIGGMHNMPT